MKKRPEREAKVLLVTKIENQERIDFENLIAGRAHLCVGGSDAFESTMLKEIFSAQSSRDVRNGASGPPGKSAETSHGHWTRLRSA